MLSTSILKAEPGKQASRYQHAFSKPSLVNLISKDTHQAFFISIIINFTGSIMSGPSNNNCHISYLMLQYLVFRYRLLLVPSAIWVCYLMPSKFNVKDNNKRGDSYGGVSKAITSFGVNFHLLDCQLIPCKDTLYLTALYNNLRPLSN